MPFDDAKAIHHMLAKMLHPDGAAPDEQARRTRLMQRANDAYDNNDLVTLRAIATEVLSGSPSPDNTAAEERRRAEQAEHHRRQEAARRAQEQAERQRQAEADAARRHEAERQRKAEAEASRRRTAEAEEARRRQAQHNHEAPQSPEGGHQLTGLAKGAESLRLLLGKYESVRFKAELDYARSEPQFNSPEFLMYLEKRLPWLSYQSVWHMLTSQQRVFFLHQVFEFSRGERS